MSDRELLELAAKAAGYTVRYVSDGNGGGSFYMEPSQLWWNPLTDDGDALRLAVKLKFDIYHYPRDSEPYVSVHDEYNHFGGSSEDYGNDPAAATRRAIVHAAAEIGKAMSKVPNVG